MSIDITKNIFNLNKRNTPILQKSYNDFQNELLRLDTHNSLVGSVNQLREDRINKNRANINNLDADLMTTRRQVEIIQNRNLIKEDIIYILRALFVFIAVTVIAYVYLQGTPYHQPVLYLLGILAAYYFGSKGLSFLSRSSNRWSMTNWQGVKYANLVAVPEEDVCAAENAAYDAQMAKVKGKILDKLIAMRSRFNKLDSNKKLLSERGEKMKNDYHEIIQKADIIFDKLPKDKQDLIIEAKKKDIAKEPRVLKTQPSQPQANASSSENNLQSMNKPLSSTGALDANQIKMAVEMSKAIMKESPPLDLLTDKDIEDMIKMADPSKPKASEKEMVNFFMGRLKSKGATEEQIINGLMNLEKNQEKMKMKI
jgi:hypothetical protein